MITLMVLIAVSAVFWGIYEQTYGSWLAFSDRVMTIPVFDIGLLTVFCAIFNAAVFDIDIFESPISFSVTSTGEAPFKGLNRIQDILTVR